MGLADEIAHGIVDQLELRDELGRESPVAVVDQTDVTPKSRKFGLLGFGTAAEFVPLGDQALNGARRGQEHEFDILLGILLTGLFAGVFRRFVRNAGKFNGGGAGVSDQHLDSLDWCEGRTTSPAKASLTTRCAIYHGPRASSVAGLIYG